MLLHANVSPGPNARAATQIALGQAWDDFNRNNLKTMIEALESRKPVTQLEECRSPRSMGVISPIRASSDSARRSFRSRLRSSIPPRAPCRFRDSDQDGSALFGWRSKTIFEGIAAKQRPGVSEI